jgi:hypothetical protein
LKVLLREWKGGLREVKKVLQEYQSLDTSDPRFRDQLAFTTSRQAELPEKIHNQSSRIQQTLSGINVSTFSRIENNTNIHYLSLLDIRAKLDEIHRDVLAGRRGTPALDMGKGAVALAEEVVGDNQTEINVNVTHEVQSWIEKVRNETFLGAQTDILESATGRRSSKQDPSPGKPHETVIASSPADRADDKEDGNLNTDDLDQSVLSNHDATEKGVLAERRRSSRHDAGRPISSDTERKNDRTKSDQPRDSPESVPSRDGSSSSVSHLPTINLETITIVDGIYHLDSQAETWTLKPESPVKAGTSSRRTYTRTEALSLGASSSWKLA